MATPPPLSRRRLLEKSAQLSAGAMALALAGRSAAGESASQLVAGKSDSLIVHTADPAVLETPRQELAAQTLTPKQLLFVRNNANPAGMMTVEAPRPAEGRLELRGVAKGPESIELATLAKMPRTSVEMVLQCSGNQRSRFSRAAMVSGTPWGCGGIGNVQFAGPKLADVLAKVGAEPARDARFLAAEGFDAPGPEQDDFEHSLPLDDALNSAILALEMNGEPLPAIHGGPVRFVMPGYYGTVQMKWLSRLRFEAEESANPHHAQRYRTPNRRLAPGEAFEFDRSNSSPTWKMKIASLITSHADGQRATTGNVALAGYAWNDGAAPLVDVLVSTDLGSTWRRAQSNRAPSPFAWSRWTFPLTLPTGRHTIWVTAVDALGRTQPIDGAIAWNPGGYEWNGVEKLELVVGG